MFEFFLFNDPATTEIYTYGHTLSLHGALPICAIIGAETFEVRDADHSMFGGIFGIREYPSSTTPRQFESLLPVDFILALTQSLTFLSSSAEPTSDLQSLMRISYAFFILNKHKNTHIYTHTLFRTHKPTS